MALLRTQAYARLRRLGRTVKALMDDLAEVGVADAARGTWRRDSYDLDRELGFIAAKLRSLAEEIKHGVP